MPQEATIGGSSSPPPTVTDGTDPRARNVSNYMASLTPNQLSQWNFLRSQSDLSANMRQGAQPLQSPTPSSASPGSTPLWSNPSMGMNQGMGYGQPISGQRPGVFSPTSQMMQQLMQMHLGALSRGSGYL